MGRLTVAVGLTSLALIACHQGPTKAGEAAAPAAQPASVVPTVTTYAGMCDASAAVALDGDRFVVADDESNDLHIFKLGGAETGKVALSGFLGVEPTKEADIEGAARIGDLVYWITSHGTNSKGKPQPERHRLFATRVVGSGAQQTLEPTGSHYDNLAEDLAADPDLAPWKLKTAGAIAPKMKGGFNIEALAATPDGHLLIGFRSPLPDKGHADALIVELNNPAEVIEGKPARLGRYARLDLDKRGIRSLEQVGDEFVGVAGPVDEESGFFLFRWSGFGSETVTRVDLDFHDLQPEALFSTSADRLYVLSDDGKLHARGPCEKLAVDNWSFRGMAIPWPPAPPNSAAQPSR